jgi:NAD(P)H-flavin reductase
METLPAPPVEPMLPVPFRVRTNRRETADTRTLELANIDGSAVPPWRPGQFMMLYAFGVGEIPISISGKPSGRTKPQNTITHTIRAVGNVSQAICRAKPGSSIGVRGPFGTAWPIDEFSGHDILLIAGGIGLAPLRPVIYTLIANRSRYGRVCLLVGARTPDILLYPREMQSWKKRGIDVHVTVDAAAPGWQESVGPVTTLISRIECQEGNATAFIVGPEIMMHFVVQSLIQRGISLDRIFVSMERNMKCALGFCGHCQLGPAFICKNGPVFSYATLEPWLRIRNL